MVALVQCVMRTHFCLPCY